MMAKPVPGASMGKFSVALGFKWFASKEILTMVILAESNNYQILSEYESAFLKITSPIGISVVTK
jgi:hypothetical protein